MARKLTYEEVKCFIETESGSGCKLLSQEYIGARDSLLIQCKCGNKFKATFNNFKSKNKRQCNKCGYEISKKVKSFTYEEVKNFIEIDSNSGCKLISKEYINAKTKMTFICECGIEFESNYDNFKNGKQQCNKCGMKIRSIKRTKTNEEFKREVYDLVGDEYVFLESYIDSMTKIKCRHNVCGHEWKIQPNSFLRANTRCPRCHRMYVSKLLSKTTDEFKQEIYKLVEDEYEFLDDYINANTKIKCRHNTCGYEWDIVPGAFIYMGVRCPQCAESKGEQAIREYLQNKDIVFNTEYSFNNLLGLGGGLLRFDFAIFGGDDKLIYLIEYDGKFHYQKQYKNDGFEDLQIHDVRKTQYCKDNNIPLLRIPYWEFDNIGYILDKWTSK